MEIPKDARETYHDPETGEVIAYCPVDQIGLSDVLRAQVIQLNLDRLQELAQKLRSEGRQNSHFVICIDVDDKTWTPLVNELMPGHDWEQYRSQGQVPMARGIVPWALLEVVTEYMPYLQTDLKTITSDVTGLVCAAGGASVFDL